MQRIESGSLAGRCGWLALALAVLWLLAIVPAWQLFGGAGIAALTFSVILCLIPGCLVFGLVTGVSASQAPVRGVLWGTLLRMGFALGGAFLMHALFGFQPRNYAVWLVLAYLVSLAVESWLLASRPLN